MIGGEPLNLNDTSHLKLITPIVRRFSDELNKAGLTRPEMLQVIALCFKTVEKLLELEKETN